MNKFKILTDSACDLPFELLEQNDVDVIGLIVNYNGKEYVEDNWKSVDISSYYTSLKEGATPTTSQITPNRFYDYFKPYLEKGMDILYVGFSSSLSGTYSTANVAKGMLQEEFPDREILLVDSMCASAGFGLLVLKAAELKREGYAAEEIAQKLEALKYNVNHIFTVDDLNHLKRGGRISGFSATMGTMLSIKPILYMSKEGKLLNIDKVKGRKKSIHALAEYLEKGKTEDLTKTVLIAHGNCEEDAALLKNLILEKKLSDEVTVVPLGMVIGAHTGANVINMVFFGKDREETVKKS
ncbi:DegV family protein [Proteiniclasticum ruminis]|uniref:DegV family protein n=1 Tax=Proteiniclasticum ruminis TaxID=398199 RepID=UPI0028AF5FC3|nr:DegV family protein [Proteiniclasticum ruminis]